MPPGQEAGVCRTYLSLTPVPPAVLASSSYSYLERCGEIRVSGQGGGWREEGQHNTWIHTNHFFLTYTSRLVILPDLHFKT